MVSLVGKLKATAQASIHTKLKENPHGRLVEMVVSMVDHRVKSV